MSKYILDFDDYMTAEAEKRGISKPQELYEPINYLLSLSGKRIRPLLSLLGCAIVSGGHRAALPAAAAIELFHNFTLMHDDIMDKSAVRRGQPTVHEQYDTNTAILSGDAMLVLAYESLLREAKNVTILPILHTFNSVAIAVCEGQQMDMNFEQRDHVTEAEYIEMIRLKTAVLLGGALKIGAYCGNATDNDADLLYQFGENIGIAFQLQDDILDTFGDQATFGKRIGGDILNNKKTFLWLKAHENATENDRTLLHQYAAQQPQTTTEEGEKIAAVTHIYTKAGARAAAESAMQSYYQKGLIALQKIRSNEAEALEILYIIADNLMQREV